MHYVCYSINYRGNGLNRLTESSLFCYSITLFFLNFRQVQNFASHQVDVDSDQEGVDNDQVDVNNDQVDVYND